MKGVVNARHEATIKLTMHGAGKSRLKFTAIVDTGYNGSITMPRSTIRKLRLRGVGESRAMLADGRFVSFATYAGILRWNGRPQAVEVFESESDPLVGMELLEGCELNVRVKTGGSVTIKRLK